MALFGGLLKTLTGVTHWVRSGVRRALTPEQIADAVEPLTGPLDDQAFEQLIGDFVEQQHVWSKIKGLPREYVIPKQFSALTGMDQRKKYRYSSFVTVEDRETHEVWDRWVSVESDHLMTKGEMEDATEESMRLLPGSEGQRLISFNDYEFLQRIGEEHAF